MVEGPAGKTQYPKGVMIRSQMVSLSRNMRLERSGSPPVRSSHAGRLKNSLLALNM
jgi:hypothetical protein